jgi:adrenodoxin-NADP+ reductase
MGASLPHPMPALHPYSIPALSLVHWYTDHPSHLAKIPPLSSIKHLTLIGHGNVSLDIARILLTPVSSLSHLDIPSPVLKELSTSSIKHINIVSRRGPAEAAFTAKELRELMTLPSTSLLPIPPELLSGETSPPPSRQQRRILDLFRKGSTAKYGTTPTTWSLEFFRTPVSASPGKITYAITALDANRKAQLTGRTETQETDLIVSSVGYESEDLYHDWFNPSLRRVRNEKGRVYSNSTGEVVKNVYTSGWASNGAKGVLGSTMYDAYDVADVLLSDHFSPSATPSSTPSVLNPDPAPGPPPVIASANESGRKVLSYEDWKKVDEEEVRRGQVLRKERERMEWDDVVRFLSR